jgi:hypothetical protein
VSIVTKEERKKRKEKRLKERRPSPAQPIYLG